MLLLIIYFLNIIIIIIIKKFNKIIYINIFILLLVTYFSLYVWKKNISIYITINKRVSWLKNELINIKHKQFNENIKIDQNVVYLHFLGEGSVIYSYYNEKLKIINLIFTLIE